MLKNRKNTVIKTMIGSFKERLMELVLFVNVVIWILCTIPVYTYHWKLFIPIIKINCRFYVKNSFYAWNVVHVELNELTYGGRGKVLKGKKIDIVRVEVRLQQACKACRRRGVLYWSNNTYLNLSMFNGIFLVP